MEEYKVERDNLILYLFHLLQNLLKCLLWFFRLPGPPLQRRSSDHLETFQSGELHGMNECEICCSSVRRKIT